MPAPRLTVATCQFPVGSDIAGNAAQIERLLRRAAAAGADLAHFPEGALSGYGPPAWPDWSGYPWQDLADATARLQATCRALGLWAVVGSNHRDTAAAKPCNSLLVIDPQGTLVDRYDKRRCSRNDLRAFTPGTRPVSFTVRGVRVGCLICLEWAFPELFQAYAENGVDLVLLSASSAASDGRRIHADVVPPLMQGHAFTQCLFLSISNEATPKQDFASFWVKRSGRLGNRCRRDSGGLTLNSIADAPDKDAFYAMVREFRRTARDGSLYAPHLSEDAR
jgi:predicted amidohydrolase